MAKQSWNERFFEAYLEESRQEPSDRQLKIAMTIASSCEVVGISAPHAGKLAVRLVSLIEDHAHAILKGKVREELASLEASVDPAAETQRLQVTNAGADGREHAGS